MKNINENMAITLEKILSENKMSVLEETIKTVANDICEIAEDYPRISDERMGVVLDLDYNLRLCCKELVVSYVYRE